MILKLYKFVYHMSQVICQYMCSCGANTYYNEESTTFKKVKSVEILAENKV